MEPASSRQTTTPALRATNKACAATVPSGARRTTIAVALICEPPKILLASAARVCGRLAGHHVHFAADGEVHRRARGCIRHLVGVDGPHQLGG